MKKLAALLTVVALLMSFAVVTSFADARDEIYLVGDTGGDMLRGGEDKGGFGTFGSNDSETELGDVSEKIASKPTAKYFLIWGWRSSSDYEITAFGYSINGGEIVWQKDAVAKADDAVKAAGGEYASRFKIKVPIYTGDVEIDLYVMYEDDPDNTEDMEWYIYYSNSTDVGNGEAPTPTPKPTAAPTPTPTATPEATATPEVTEAPEVTDAPAENTTASASSGCGSVIGGGAAALLALLLAAFIKRR